MEQSERLLPRSRGPILAFLLTPLVALGLAIVVTRIVGPPPKLDHVPPAGLVWGDRVFVSSRPFSAWLKLHGSSYGAWRAQHPRAALRLEHNDG